MRDRRARVAMLGLVLMFPGLILAAAPVKSSARLTSLTVVGVEAVLMGGLFAAARERRMLLSEQLAAPELTVRASRAVPSFPHARPTRAATARGVVR